MPETNASVLSLILTCPSVSPPPQSHDATAAAKRLVARVRRVDRDPDVAVDVRARLEPHLGRAEGVHVPVRGRARAESAGAHVRLRVHAQPIDLGIEHDEVAVDVAAAEEVHLVQGVGVADLDVGGDAAAGERASGVPASAGDAVHVDVRLDGGGVPRGDVALDGRDVDVIGGRLHRAAARRRRTRRRSTTPWRTAAGRTTRSRRRCATR